MKENVKFFEEAKLKKFLKDKYTITFNGSKIKFCIYNRLTIIKYQ